MLVSTEEGTAGKEPQARNRLDFVKQFNMGAAK
jgi:hypothetical protein